MSEKVDLDIKGYAEARDTRPQPDSTAEPVAEPVAATREWANSLANIRQGQRDTPRCEPPTEFEVNRASADIKAVLQATTPLYTATALDQARREALEQAAKVADQMAITQRALGQPEDWPEDAWNARQVGIIDKLERAAEKIRALKGSQQ